MHIHGVLFRQIGVGIYSQIVLRGAVYRTRDDPKKQALLRCYQRLNKDVSRGNLASEQRDVLYAKAEDLHHEARMNPEITFEAFDRSLATDHLCHLCNITRSVKKAGRPKKNN